MRFVERREAHRLTHNNIVIQHLLHFVCASQHERTGFAVWNYVKDGWSPFLVHLVKSRLNGIFFAGRLADLGNLLIIIHQLQINDILQGFERLPRHELEPKIVAHCGPVPLS